MSFGANLTGFNLVNFFARNLDNILIGKYSGAIELGFYDRAYKLLLFPDPEHHHAAVARDDPAAQPRAGRQAALPRALPADSLAAGLHHRTRALPR